MPTYAATPPLSMASPPLILLLLLSFLPSGTPVLAGDKAALIALRASVGRSVLHWNATASPYSWRGVYCSGLRVTAVRLPAVGLRGVIPAGTIGNLTALRVLSLRLNSLSGSLPPDISNLHNLRSLFLQGNHFSGELPGELFSLSGLAELDLAANNFSGAISPLFNSLTRLRSLFLQNNQLSGELPNINLPRLIEFNVSYNKLNGWVPPGLRSMPGTSFLGMPLCGGPLPPCSPKKTPSPSPSKPPAPTATPPSSGAGSCGGKKSSKYPGSTIAGIVVGSVGWILIMVGSLIVCRRRSQCAGRTRSSTAAAGPTLPEVSSQDATRPKPPEHSAPAAARPKPREVLSSTGPKPSKESSAAAARQKLSEESLSARPKQREESSSAGGNGEKRLLFYGRREEEFTLEELFRGSMELLGSGPHGTSYKTVMENGMTVVVKQLREVKLEERELEERIEAISSVRHENVVRLLASFARGRLLVYDYLPNGSLSALLRVAGSGRATLDWSKRCSIALAAARGMQYIHTRGTNTSHGNIKSSNILLCSSNDACVSEHALHQLSGPELRKDANGYRAPEVTDARKVSQMADVYSFGLLLLELLTGEAPPPNGKVAQLRGLVLAQGPKRQLRVFDPELKDPNVQTQMGSVLQLAVDCTSPHPQRRPSMSDVLARLEQIIAWEPEPTVGENEASSDRGQRIC